MVILNIHLDNIFLFRNFDLCFSYPKKPIRTTIPHEHLKDHPNFRYRKLVILMGANATGKTALGKALMTIFNFISRQEAERLYPLVDNRTEPASILLDMAFSNNRLYRLTIDIKAKKDFSDEYTSDDIIVSVKAVNIRSNDNYETCAARFSSDDNDSNMHYTKALEQLPFMTWGFEYPYASDGNQRAINPANTHVYASILKRTMKILDPRIEDVFELEQVENTYVIIYPNRKIIIQNGSIVDPSMLSSGTKDIVGVSQLLTEMKLKTTEFFYCDEKFSHVHTDLEKAFLSVMIELLQPNQQLIFTTHNLDILDMDLPIHSYAFLRRDEYDNTVSCSFASDYLQKNTASLRNAVANDLFSSSPVTDDVFHLVD